MKHILLLIILLNSINIVYGQEKSDISDYSITLNEYGPETKKALKKIKSSSSAAENVYISDTISQEIFNAFCKDCPWVTGLSIYGNNKIQSLEPLKNLKSLKKFAGHSLEKPNNERFDLKPLANLKKLEVLDLYGTKFTNSITLKNLKNLKEINFHMSDVQSLEFLSSLPNVEKINLYGEDHTFKGYKPLSGLKKLKYLNTYMNLQATDKLLLELSPLNSLEVFESANNREATNLNFLKNCSKIKKIDMKWASKLKDISIIKEFNYLENLDIEGSLVKDISALQGKKSIKKLDVSDTEIENYSIIGGLENLEGLALNEVGIKDISFLKKLKKLQKLQLKETVLTDISPLSNLKNLTELDLSKSKVVDIGALSECKKLVEIKITDTSITDLSPLEGLKNLIQVYYSETVPSKHIDELKKKLPKCQFVLWK